MSPLFERLRSVARVEGPRRVVSRVGQDPSLAESRTVARLFDEASFLGERMRAAHGDLRGRAVLLALPPGLDWVRAFLAVLSEGGTAVPVSRLAAPPEVAYVVDDAGAELAVVGAELEELVPKELLRVEARIPTDDPAIDGAGARLGQRSERAALLLYTSGTTGKPKGVPIRGAQLEAQTSALREAWGFVPEDVLLHALPLHHLHGIVVALLTALTVPCSITMLERFDAHVVLDELERASVWMSVPTMLEKLTEHVEGLDPDERARAGTRLRELRLVTSGSAALPVSLARRWAELAGSIPLERYGMTEIGMALSNPLEPSRRTVGSVGRPLSGVELRIVDDAGADVDGPGELWVRGPSVFDGYHRRPDATRDAFVDGWFKTGDVGRREVDGSIRLLGRTSVDILKSGGEKISALEVEEALREHEGIAEVAVVGLPDQVWGERVVAAVVPRVGARPEADALRAHVRARLAAYKVPKEVIFLEALPRNAMGKVQKPELVRRLRGEA
jgi:malonyl-CoA/methylmalonyl-CoA synthetase